MFDWKTLVKTIAPTLGTALGGPLGGVATKLIADKLLGNDSATEEQIAQTLNNPTPEQIIKLKELDQSFALEMQKLNIEQYKIDADDRASARGREIAVKDWTPSILAYIVIIGVFVMVWKLLADGIISQVDQMVLTILSNLGMVVLSYYFGSSNRDNKK